MQIGREIARSPPGAYGSRSGSGRGVSAGELLDFTAPRPVCRGKHQPKPDLRRASRHRRVSSLWRRRDRPARRGFSGLPVDGRGVSSAESKCILLYMAADGAFFHQAGGLVKAFGLRGGGPQEALEALGADARVEKGGGGGRSSCRRGGSNAGRAPGLRPGPGTP